jgi:hypothetical protein
MAAASDEEMKSFLSILSQLLHIHRASNEVPELLAFNSFPVAAEEEGAGDC